MVTLSFVCAQTRLPMMCVGNCSSKDEPGNKAILQMQTADG